MNKKYKELSCKKGTKLTAVVRAQGNGASINAPKKWIGKKVEIKIIED